MKTLTEQIAQLRDTEIGDVLSAVVLRYGELFPDWEISTISLKKGEDRNQQIDRMVQMLMQMKSLA